MKIIEELEQLQDEIQRYGEYLEHETYNPYDRVQEFARRLKKIIEDAKND